MKIETVGIETIDGEQYHVGFPMEHVTIKEAKEWVKEALMRASYWDQLAERKDFHKEVTHIHILKNGDIHTEYETKFTQ
jgi:hypothetical protein